MQTQQLLQIGIHPLFITKMRLYPLINPLKLCILHMNRCGFRQILFLHVKGIYICIVYGRRRFHDFSLIDTDDPVRNFFYFTQLM